MTSAAAGFFDHTSRGYKALQTASEVMYAAQLAMNLASIAPAMAAGAAQMFAQSGWGGFAGVAAMTALIAGFGVAVSGGGSGMSAADRQAAQGTGTVLGDSSAKSDSIAKAIELSASNSSTQINYLSGMLTALQSIQSGITSFASEVVQGTNITNPNVSLNTNNGLATTIGTAAATAGGSLVGGMAGGGLTAFTSLGSIGGPIGSVVGALAGYALSKIPAISNLMTSIFGGKQSVNDSGFTMGKESLGDISRWGANAQSYADIKTSGGWFSSDKYSTQMQSLGADANNQFTAVIKSIASSVSAAADLLGAKGPGFTDKLNSFVVDIGNVSLKGLSADEIQKQLESVFSKLGDQMAQFAIPNLTQFEQVGEGYLQTLVRVASDYAKVDASMQSIGRTFGSVGLSSIAARESLISLMGGIDKLQSTASDYAQNFLTKAQQLAPVQAFVTQQMTALNLGWVHTREQFASVVQCLDLTTTSGQQTYAALMNLESAFAAVTPAIQDTSKSAQDIADERKGLQDQFDQLTMTQTQLLQKQRDALDAANQPLFDMVQAAQKLADTSTNMAKFRDAAKSLSDSLMTGSLSTLTPEQQYQQLRDQYEKVKAAALAGDTTAQDNYSSSLTAFLTASQKINGGDSQYRADFMMGQQDAASMASWASNQVDTATAQLNAMQSQNTELNTANTSLQTLVDTVKQLQATNAELKDEIAGLRADQQKQTGDGIVSNMDVTEKGTQTVSEGLRDVVSAVRALQTSRVALE